MNTRRLLKLAKYLDTVPEDDFDMDVWKCDTTACALGHACTIPSFKEKGLYMDYGSPVFAKFVGGVTKKFVGSDAGAEFFGLTHKQAENLFYPGSYQLPEGRFKVTTKDVSAKIRRLVSSHNAALASVKARKARVAVAARRAAAAEAAEIAFVDGDDDSDDDEW